MKTLRKTLPAVLGLAALLPAFALAQPSPENQPGRCGKMELPPEHRGLPEAGMMPGMPLPPFLHGLDLSETQRDAIFAILHADAPAVRDRMKAAHKAHEALRDLSLSGKYDETKAKELAETAADNMAVLSLLRSRSESRIYALLTPEQRKQVNELKDQFGPLPANARLAKPKTGEARAL